ncbi:CRISPR-associated protein Csn2-St [Lactovum odontotermitis]
MMKIELEDNKFISFDEYDRLFFCGSNTQMKQKLVRSLKRFANNKSLNELEEIVYGDNGLEIYRDDQLLNAKNIDIHFLQDNLSIYREVEFSKTSLMGSYIKSFSEKVEVNIELEEIKNHFLALETIVNNDMKNVSDNISANFLDLSFDLLIKNHLFLSYFDEHHDYPLEMMDAEILLDEYIQLLENQLSRLPKETWIVLINPESFISQKGLAGLLKNFDEISERTGQLKIFIISNLALVNQYSCDDIPKTIVLADEAYQMPDFDSFRKNIENHYPTQVQSSDQELCQLFCEIVSDIGADPAATGKSAKSMVLLKVIDEILGFDNLTFPNRFGELSELEKSYLLSKN